MSMRRQTSSPSGATELTAFAPIIWAKWGDTFLEALRQEALDVDDGLAFRAMNSDAGIRKLLVVCTISGAQIRNVEAALSASSLGPVLRPVDWKGYSIAEMVFKTEKGNGLGCQEIRDGSNRSALVLCATRPASVQTLEKLFDLPE